jgi:hypothetical protein
MGKSAATAAHVICNTTSGARYHKWDDLAAHPGSRLLHSAASRRLTQPLLRLRQNPCGGLPIAHLPG